MIARLILFLVLNFSALAIGGRFTGPGVSSDWYQNLNKAPWTPPGWVFGAAWTTIMICFAFYMMYLWETIENKRILIGLFSIQWILNVLWNPIFFKYQAAFPALLVIILLTIVVGYFLFGFRSTLQYKATFALPYFLWLLIATSLNAFILFKN